MVKIREELSIQSYMHGGYATYLLCAMALYSEHSEQCQRLCQGKVALLCPSPQKWRECLSQEQIALELHVHL